MAQLKSTNVTGNLAVTGNILASKIIKLGGTENQILMADGSVIDKSSIQGTTYTGGTGITIGTGNAINHSNSVTAVTTAGLYKIKYDAQGHITGTAAIQKADITDLGIPGSDTDTGATSVEVTGTGNAVTTASYEASTRKITLTKGTTFLTSHQSIKTLKTDNTTAQTTSANEAIAGSGTINLHKVSKTGTYSDLIGTPDLSGFATKTDLGNYFPKTTYEWNKEYAAGGNGAISLGRYKIYDTQLTFDITTTTSDTISGKLVIAAQNGVIFKATVYGDASNTLTGYLTIYQSAITSSRSWVEVFCNFPGWSKNKVHIYGVALDSATVTNQMASVTFSNGVPSGVTSGDAKWTGTIENDITSNCALKSELSKYLAGSYGSDTTKFLRNDGSWVAPPVTSIPSRLGPKTNSNNVAPDNNHTTGFAYYGGTAGTNGLPANVQDAEYITLGYDNSTWAHQLLFKFNGGGVSGSSYDGTDVYTRIYNNSAGKWSDWHTIVTSGNHSKVLGSSYVSKVTSTDNAIARFDGTSGAIQNSNVTIDDSGDVLINGNKAATETWVQSQGYLTSHQSLSGYLPLSGGTMTGRIDVASNMCGLLFRSNSDTWYSGIRHGSAGDEALVFENVNPRTSWIFRIAKPTDYTNSWTEVVPCLHIKNQRVAINKLIADGQQASYNLDVEGTIGASGSIYCSSVVENGTSLENKYVTTGTEQKITGRKLMGNSTGETSISHALDAIVIGPNAARSTTANSYYPGISFNHMLGYSDGYKSTSQGWIGLRLYDTPGSERSYLVFATKEATAGGGGDRPVERMCIDPFGKVGIGVLAPTKALDVSGDIQASGSVIGSLIKSDSTVAAMKMSAGNELSFASSATSLYIGYSNNAGSSKLVDTYYFGTHSGSSGSRKGGIVCGTVNANNYYINGSSNDYVVLAGGGTKALSEFENTATVEGDTLILSRGSVSGTTIIL